VILAPAENQNSNVKHKINLHKIIGFDYLYASSHSSSDCNSVEPDTPAVINVPPPEDTGDTIQVLINDTNKHTKFT